MNMERFKRQHQEILQRLTGIDASLQHDVATHATQIVEQLVAICSTLRLHLSIEDMLLYPTLHCSNDPDHAIIASQYRRELQGFSADYAYFIQHWADAASVAAHPQQFLAEAEPILQRLRERIRREDAELYPALETL